MKKDWLAAIAAFPAILLEIIGEPIQRFLWEEKEVLEGAEYDTEADPQQGAQEENNTGQL